MGHELLCREGRRDRQLEGSLRLAVGCAEVALDPDIVIMDQVAVEFCHGAFWNAAEEYDKTAFFHHMDALSLRSVDGCGGDDLVGAFSACELSDRFDRVGSGAVHRNIHSELLIL